MVKILLVLNTLFLVSFCNAQDSSAIKNTNETFKELPVLFQQTAAEYRALCYQAFNAATVQLENETKVYKGKRKLAIITDLDETILDNSYMEAQLIKANDTFSNKTWHAWTIKGAATAVPGAVSFLQAAHKKGVEIFYISNRDTGEVAITLSNLKQLRLPDADTAHSLFAAGSYAKEARRKRVAEKYDVIMLLGDNLNDFAEVFEKKTIKERAASTDQDQALWGTRFIVLPNPVYGEWENALYQYKKTLSADQKEHIRLQLLQGF